ncbi:MAG: ion channel [Chloroflexota bacterium]|nr:ion channel [Chloroflexota bacterium]
MRWRLVGPLLALLLIQIGGTLGYLLIEGWSVGDAAHMALITVATIGYGEVTVLALPRGGSILTPPPELILQPGDALAVTGTAGQLRTVEATCAGALAREPA